MFNNITEDNLRVTLEDFDGGVLGLISHYPGARPVIAISSRLPPMARLGAFLRILAAARSIPADSWLFAIPFQAFLMADGSFQNIQEGL